MNGGNDRQVRWLKAALDDLTVIVEYIAEDSPQAAGRFAEGIFAKSDLLGNTPHLGARCPRHPKARQLLHGNYIIYYTVEAERVVVRAVVHGARLFRAYWLERED